MGLESATYIGQLVATNPTDSDAVSQGDNHLRLIKSVLQSQFPSLGNAAVTVTAAQLNAVTSKLTSFNGRTAPAVVPTEGDYDLTELGDVTITTPASGEILRYNGSAWVNIRGSAANTAACFLYDGFAATVTDSIYFSNARRNTVGAGLGTIKNDSSGGIGWTFTAAADCLIQINMQALYLTNSGFTMRAGIGVFFSPSSPTAALPSAGTNRLGYSGDQNTSDILDDLGVVVSGATVLAAGDKIAVYLQDSTEAPDEVTLSGFVLAL